MPVYKLNIPVSDLDHHVPAGFSVTPIEKINKELHTAVIKGKIKKRWPLQKTKTSQHFSLVLEDANGSSINVFFFDAIAEELNACKTDDVLMLADFKVQKSSTTTTSKHVCQIEVDKSASVWIVDPSAVTGRGTHQNPSDGLTTSKKPRFIYQYTLLKDLKINTLVDIYAVIKYVRPVKKSRGTDYSMLLSLVDPSLCNDKVKCLLFAKSEEKLPPAEVGNVIRMHRLKILRYNGELQGQSCPGFSWLLFNTPVRSDSNPRASSRNFTFGDEDQKTVDDLFAWFENTDDLSQPTSSISTLADVTPRLYFDFVCQVVSTSVIEEGVSFLLSVWDGTSSLFPVRQFEVNDKPSNMLCSEPLKRKAAGFIADVCLFDDHFTAGRSIKPGDFVKLFNLHAAEFKDTETLSDCSELPVVELCLHRGTSYGRCVTKLNPESTEARDLAQRLDAVGAKDVPVEILSERTVNNNNKDVGAAGTQLRKICEEDRLLDVTASYSNSPSSADPEPRQTAPDGCDSGQVNTDSLDDQSQSRCMLETATVITGHHHIKRTKIRDVLQHDVPYKFRILARLLKIQPNPSSMDFIKLFCPECKYLCSVKDVQKSDESTIVQPPNLSDSENRSFMELINELDSVENQTPPPPVCPKCGDQQDSPAYMEYTYMLRLVLHDGTGWLIANLWRQDAICFFKSTSPEEVLKDSSSQGEITQWLTQLCPPEGNRPWLECCVCSYTGLSGVCYKIIDTTIA